MKESLADQWETGDQISVEVVCRLNQARSVAIAAFLSQRYPHLSIASSGIEARTGTSVNAAVSQILANWGFASTGTESTASQEQVARIGTAQVVIAADNYVKQQLIKLPLSEQKIFDINEEVKSPFFRVADPVDMTIEQLSLELAKGIIASNDLISRIFEIALKERRNKVFGVIPMTEDDETPALELALDISKREEANILDLSSLSRHRDIRTSNPVLELDSIHDTDAGNEIYKNQEARIWKFKHESLILSRDILHPSLLNLKKTLWQTRPLVLLGGAIRVNGNFKACHLFALLDCDPENRFIVDSKS
jgi:protein-tyrosine-phosphatase